MYRILVVSDSHGDTKYITDAIERIKAIDCIVHLGDFAKDAQNIEAMYPEISHAYVRGNCDIMSNAPDEKIITAEGFRLLLTHGHGYGVKSGIERLLSYAKEKAVNGVLFGHTHLKKCEWIDHILFLNPGSGHGYTSSPAIGFIEIENNKLRGCVL